MTPTRRLLSWATVFGVLALASPEGARAGAKISKVTTTSMIDGDVSWSYEKGKVSGSAPTPWFVNLELRNFSGEAIINCEFNSSQVRLVEYLRTGGSYARTGNEEVRSGHGFQIWATADPAGDYMYRFSLEDHDEDLRPISCEVEPL